MGSTVLAAGKIVKAAVAINEAKNAIRTFKSFSALKRALGPAGEGKVWHHIVEQREPNIDKFGAEAIHNTENCVPISRELNQKIADYYSTKQPFSGGKTVRDWLYGQSFAKQSEFGIKIMKQLDKN